MSIIKISLINCEQAVCAQADLPDTRQTTEVFRLFKRINQELIPGQRAYLEIDGLNKEPVTLEILHSP